MNKINYENICTEQLFKNVHSVTPISKCNRLVKIECVCENPTEGEHKKYEIFFLNEKNIIVAHFKSDIIFNADLLHEKNTQLFVLEYFYDKVREKYPIKIVRVELNGNITLLNVYENIEFGIEDGCFAVKKDGLWGFIDDKGNEIIPPMYQQYNSFHDGLACVKKDGLWGIIDKQNNVILPFKYYRCKDFHDGISIVENLDYSNDVIKPSGQILHSVLPFSQIFNLGNGSILLETSIKGSFQIVKIKE